MRMSALAARRAALVEKLVGAAEEAVWSALESGWTLHDKETLHARFTALLASRWQT